MTDAKLGVSGFRWAPDGRRIAFVARVPEAGRYGTVEDLGPAAEPPRRITTLKYQSNGLGYLIDRRAQVFLLEVPDVAAEPAYRIAPSAADPSPAPAATVPEPTQLTDGDYDHGAIAFSPDGTRLAFVSARHESRDIDLANNVFELRLDVPGVQPEQRTGRHLNYSVSELGYAADGALFLIAGDVGEGRDFVARNGSLYLLEAPGEPARLLTDPETIDVGEGGLTVLEDGSALVQNRACGTVQLLRVTRDGDIRSLTGGALEVTGHGSAGGVTVVSFSDAATAGDVAVVRGGALTVLTDFSAQLRSRGIVPPVELTVTARDGYPVHGWVLMPGGDGPHPVLLNIHGGPFAQYSVSLFDEAQVYAAAGYAVVMCNPRGSAGYGQQHGRAIRQKMGTLDFTDVIDFLEGALAEYPTLDGGRVGVMGGSYGGYLTAWTIAQDHRFAAAIVERGFLDPEYFIGTSDIGDFFSDEYTGTEPELVRAQSPQAVVHQVTTPTLIIHSENDLRCPLGQGERYFAALKRQGVEAELLVFPGENHELSRSGRPRHRLQRFEAILDWWARYLPVGTNTR